MVDRAGEPIIDIHKAAGTFLWDTSVLVLALDARRTEPDAPLARAVYKAIQRHVDARILISAVSFAEFMKVPGRELPRAPRVIVVPFDESAALQCARRVPQTVPDGDPRPAAYWKRDALIIATGLEHGVDGFISADEKQLTRAAEVGLKPMRLADFVAEPDPQMDFFSMVARGPLK